MLTSELTANTYNTKCKGDTFIVLSSTAFHSFIHLRVINTSGIERCGGGEAVTSYLVWYAWDVSYVRALIDYLSIIFYVFIYIHIYSFICIFIYLFIVVIFSRPERKKETGSKVSAIKRYLILMHCFHADKLSFTCPSGSWDPKNASRQNISSGKSSTRS